MLTIAVAYIKPHCYDDFICWSQPVSSGGIVLDPFALMINHACDPNTTWNNEGKALRFRAAKDIPAGTELTIAYGHTSEKTTRHDRRTLSSTSTLLARVQSAKEIVLSLPACSETKS
jgi:hypothetical protein